MTASPAGKGDRLGCDRGEGDLRLEKSEKASQRRGHLSRALKRVQGSRPIKAQEESSKRRNSPEARKGFRGRESSGEFQRELTDTLQIIKTADLN